MRAARAGLIGISTTNSRSARHPLRRPRRARSARTRSPSRRRCPTGVFCLDMATSQVAINRIFNARDDGPRDPGGLGRRRGGAARPPTPPRWPPPCRSAATRDTAWRSWSRCCPACSPAPASATASAALYGDAAARAGRGPPPPRARPGPARRRGAVRRAAGELLAGLCRQRARGPGSDEVLVPGEPEERAAARARGARHPAAPVRVERAARGGRGARRRAAGRGLSARRACGRGSNCGIEGVKPVARGGSRAGRTGARGELCRVSPRQGRATRQSSRRSPVRAPAPPGSSLSMPGVRDAGATRPPALGATTRPPVPSRPMGEGGSTAVPRLAPAAVRAAGSAPGRRWTSARRWASSTSASARSPARTRPLHTVRALEHAPGPWGICGVAPRRRAAIDALGPQDGLYAVVERRPDGDRAEVLALAARRRAPAPRRRARIADPAVHVVTLTITERGYPRDGAGGLADDDAVRADLAGGPPRTALGQLVRGLQARMAGGEAGGAHGDLVRQPAPQRRACSERLVHDFCARLPAGGGRAAGRLGRRARRASRARWSTASSRPPSPRDRDDGPPAARRRRPRRRGGRAVRQWVLEDAFAGAAPRLGARRRAARRRLGAVGAAQAAAAQRLALRARLPRRPARRDDGRGGAARRRRRGRRPPPAARRPRAHASRRRPACDVDAYVEEFLARFANPRLGHPLQQIAADGSEKLAARIFPAARERLRAGAEPRWIALVVAAWARHLDGAPGPEVRDEHAAALRAALARAGDARPRARGGLPRRARGVRRGARRVAGLPRPRRRRPRPPRRRRARVAARPRWIQPARTARAAASARRCPRRRRRGA